MNKLKSILFAVFVLGIVASTFAQKSNNWQNELQEQLQLLGHRNWVLIVDAAYPLQSKPAIKTIVTGESQLDVVQAVLDAVENAPHVFPEVFLDKEIDFVLENEAKGINSYKQKLDVLLEDKVVTKEPHENLISMIDESAKTFNVLVLKTNLTIPYTSVFLPLNCGYWTPEQEAKMRELMKN